MDDLGREKVRLHALRQLKLLDTPPSESFDRIVRMAGKLFKLPIAAVSLTDQDRQWFKSRIGVEHWQIPREKAPCGEVANTARVLVLPDLLEDPCYQDSLLARSGIRFYAGAPLTTRDGFCLGAMCVLGTEPRTATEEEMSALSDLAEMAMAQIELQHAFGRLDPITGVPNRNQFLEDLQDRGRDQAGQSSYVVVAEMLDALRMAEAVRVLGGQAIDDLMRQVARELSIVLGPQSHLYQVGTAQLALLLSPTHRHDAIEQDAERLTRRVEALIRKLSLPALARPAIGLAPITLGTVNGEDALRMAQTAAQEARSANRLVGCYSVTADDEHQRRFRLLADMRNALSGSDELYLVYQPKLDFKSSRCVGVEALLRWRHPTLGMVSPGEFVPLVEQTELAGPLTGYVIDAALRQMKLWRQAGIDVPISVNVSAVNLEDPTFPLRLCTQVAASGLLPESLELEVTESAIIRNRTRVVATLQALRAGGFRIAIDDFGTGYSSLSYLTDLPADVLKIDQSFIRELASGQKGRTLVEIMIGMAHRLGFTVVAEGIEDHESMDYLAAWECDAAQGFLISRPIPAEALEIWLMARGEITRMAA